MILKAELSCELALTASSLATSSAVATRTKVKINGEFCLFSLSSLT